MERREVLNGRQLYRLTVVCDTYMRQSSRSPGEYATVESVLRFDDTMCLDTERACELESRFANLSKFFARFDGSYENGDELPRMLHDFGECAMHLDLGDYPEEEVHEISKHCLQCIRRRCRTDEIVYVAIDALISLSHQCNERLLYELVPDTYMDFVDVTLERVGTERAKYICEALGRIARRSVRLRKAVMDRFAVERVEKLLKTYPGGMYDLCLILDAFSYQRMSDSDVRTTLKIAHHVLESSNDATSSLIMGTLYRAVEKADKIPEYFYSYHLIGLVFSRVDSDVCRMMQYLDLVRAVAIKGSKQRQPSIDANVIVECLRSPNADVQIKASNCMSVLVKRNIGVMISVTVEDLLLCIQEIFSNTVIRVRKHMSDLVIALLGTMTADEGVKCAAGRIMNLVVHMLDQEVDRTLIDVLSLYDRLFKASITTGLTDLLWYNFVESGGFAKLREVFDQIDPTSSEMRMVYISIENLLRLYEAPPGQ